MTDSTNADSQRTTPGGVSIPREALETLAADFVRYEAHAHDNARASVYKYCAERLREMIDQHAAATPARSSLPPDFGKLIDEVAITAIYESRLEPFEFAAERTRAHQAARAALESAIASLGQPSGDLERAAKVADGLDKPFNVKPRTVQGKSFERGARTAAKEIADGIRALASLAEKP